MANSKTKVELNWRAGKVDEIIDEFRIWAKRTGNEDWIGFATIKFNQLGRQGITITNETAIQELHKIQNTIRKVKSI